jgi:hypothetical protein
MTLPARSPHSCDVLAARDSRKVAGCR